MVYVMNRYQIYLDPKTVSVFDQVAANLGLSRSQIVRDLLDRVAREYTKALSVAGWFSVKSHPLLKMSGKLRGGSSDLSSRVDEIYYKFKD